MMEDADKIVLNKLFSELSSLKNQISRVKTRLSDQMKQFEQDRGGKEKCVSDHRFWMLFVHFQAAEKIQLMIENDEELFGLQLLSVTRFFFELNVWLWFIVEDPENSLVFYYKLLENQIEHVRNYLDKANEEIELFGILEQEDSKTVGTAFSGVPREGGTDEELREAAKKLTDLGVEIDRKARRKFSLFARQARTNGYGFQARLIKNKIVPLLNHDISDFITRIKIIEPILKPKQLALVKAKWNWRDRAIEAGMAQQYKFLYSLTSTLLHATPFSIATPTTLAAQEQIMFLDYIYISILDFLDIVQGLESISINTSSLSLH